jgi:SAM-dependent methyltransferase
MANERIISDVSAYYSGKVRAHGATARGVDWNSTESQELRFRELLRVCEGVAQPLSLNDFGCGYGGLHDHLQRAGIAADYRGFDISEAMLEEARRQHPALAPAAFVASADALPTADVTVASGIFNVKLETATADWERYVAATIAELARLSRRGFAFNMLTSYSDRDRMRDDLYYGDPRYYFDLCKREYSRWVALLHDYGLYEFTIIVRLEG